MVISLFKIYLKNFIIDIISFHNFAVFIIPSKYLTSVIVN